MLARDSAYHQKLISVSQSAQVRFVLDQLLELCILPNLAELFQLNYNNHN